MESEEKADISTLEKTGHLYFGPTQTLKGYYTAFMWGSSEVQESCANRVDSCQDVVAVPTWGYFGTTGKGETGRRG